MARFASLDDVHFTRLPVDKNAENTHKATKMLGKIFQNSLVEKGFSSNFKHHRAIFNILQLCHNSSTITVNYVVNFKGNSLKSIHHQ